jgi:hypothetical protein
MKRHSKVGRPHPKPRRQNALKLKHGSAANATRRPSSAARLDEEIVRLTRELEEALERQTATSEVLRALSQGFQLQSVLQSVAESAAKLCRSDGAVIFQLQDGVYRFAAGYSLSSAPLYGQADRVGQEFRRPGGYRHRERAAAQRAASAHHRPHGGAGAADSNFRGATGYFKLSR